MEELHYLCSEHKGTDLYREADLRLCFSHMQRAGLSRHGSYKTRPDVAHSLKLTPKLFSLFLPHRPPPRPQLAAVVI